jgi:hypothetical protein
MGLTGAIGRAQPISGFRATGKKPAASRDVFHQPTSRAFQQLAIMGKESQRFDLRPRRGNLSGERTQIFLGLLHDLAGRSFAGRGFIPPASTPG